MNFTEPVFFAFFGAFLLAYYALRNELRLQNWLIAAASYFFYGWFDWRFCALLALSTVLDFCFGLIIDFAKHNGSSDDQLLAKRTLILSVVCNLAILGFFKYFGFFAESAERLLEIAGLHSGNWVITQIALPAGISFYTFQSLSYIFDVYDGKLRATKSLLSYSVFVSFFPHLVAGPILRASDLMPKVLSKRVMTRDMFWSGILLALYGYLIKLVIADNLAPVVEAIYQNPNARGAPIWLATYAFAFQIYCDFLGYTSIARGIARMMGFELVLNFNLPYFASNPVDFWRRWHISLSTWLRDYLYIRLGGNRHGLARTCFALMVTMLLGGLWHGAAWHFVAWGAFHGTLLIAYRIFSRSRFGGWYAARVPKAISVLLFFQVTCVGWLLFRAQDLMSALEKLRQVAISFNLTDIAAPDAKLVAGLVLPLVAFEFYQYRTGRLEPWLNWSPAVMTIWVAAVEIVIAWIRADVSAQFIYFQF
jgi:alginate O-acetyltransferase complex protein AlgI